MIAANIREVLIMIKEKNVKNKLITFLIIMVSVSLILMVTPGVSAKKIKDENTQVCEINTPPESTDIRPINEIVIPLNGDIALPINIDPGDVPSHLVGYDPTN